MFYLLAINAGPSQVRAAETSRRISISSRHLHSDLHDSSSITTEILIVLVVLAT